METEEQPEVGDKIIRDNRRIAYKCPIRFKDDDGEEGKGTVTDMSLGGWKIACSKPPRKGTYLSLEITLPDYTQPLKVELASVRWATAKEFGVVFLRMDETEQKRLQTFLETFQEA